MENKRIKILNMKFENITREELLASLEGDVTNNKKTFLVTANPEIVMHANNDPNYLSVVNKANYVIPDGIGVIIASKIIKEPLPERIPGFEVMGELLKMGNEKRWSAYFLGAKKEVIEKAVQNIKETYPKLKIAGWHDGYFDRNSTHITNEITLKIPDLIFVALGFPKQEMWIAENLDKFNKGLFMGVGGSFDVLAGEVKRAPELWQKMNLEWFYRLIKQPSRWRRMLVLPQFILKVMSGKIMVGKKRDYE
jgi:N-acetylglucosaminyldiphosphoundecaprenol N-acetyl-beta-D-mannosaminyltransferase